MKTRITAIILCMLLCLGLTACNITVNVPAGETEGSQETSIQDQQTEKQELTIGALTLFTASNLDPAAEWNGWFDSLFGIGETLFILDDAMNPKPHLVESYDYDDDRTWTLVLRDDVFYTNGEKMTAETVKASLERTLEVCDRAYAQLRIESMEADGQTLKIITDQPMPALLNELCDPIGVIEYVADGIDYENAPVLTGPFIAQEFRVYDIMVVTANDNYWGGDVKLSKVTFKTYSDGDALTMALQKGEIDAAYDLPTTALALFNTDGFKVNQVAGPRGQALFFNQNSEAAADIELRTAIDMAIDREGFVELMNGNAEVNYGMFPESMSCGGTDRLILRVTKDTGLEDAAKILADAGYADTDGDGILEKDGSAVSLVMAIGLGESDSLFAQALRSNLRQIGIDLQIEPHENTNTTYEEGTFDIALKNLHMAPTGNPQYFFDLCFLPGVSNNNGGYDNPEVTSLIEKLAATADPDERNDIAFEIEQKVLDDMYYLVFANIDFTSVCKDTVTGLVMNPSEYYIVDMNTNIN